MKKLACALCLILSSAIAWADFMSGNDLLTAIRGKTSDAISYSRAQGYVAATSDSLNQIMFCIPQGVTVGQMMDVVKLHLEAHPEKRHFGANQLVVNAFQAAFECPKK